MPKHDTLSEVHPPFIVGATAPTSTSLGYPLRVGMVWLDTSGGIGVQRRCVAVDGAGAGTWRIDGPAVVKLPLGDSDGPGGVLAWQNPEGASIFLTSLVLNLDAGTHGAPLDDTLQVGIAADAATASDVINGNVNIATGGNPAITAPTGGGYVIVGTGLWVTISTATGSAAGLAGHAYLYYHLA